MNLEEAESRYLQEQPIYTRLGEHMIAMIKELLSEQGVSATYDYRTKEASSLIAKILRKRYDSLDRVTDKLGLRIIVSNIREIPRIVSSMESAFHVTEKQDKANDLSPDRLGYLGTHLQIELKPEQLASGVEDEFRGRSGELQIRTHAQDLWNVSSHKYLYKPEVPPPAQVARRLYRLMALVEIYDNEFSSSMEAIEQLPGAENWKTLRNLEEKFIRLGGQRFNEQLSVTIIDQLLPIARELGDEWEHHVLEAFVASNQIKLRNIYHDYQAAGARGIFVTQPESLLIWMLLERRVFDLVDVWREFMPIETLDRMASIWGISLPGQ